MPLAPTPPDFRFPAEWAIHRAVWLAWPCHAELWQANLPRAQAEFALLCRAIVDLDGMGTPRGEALEVLVHSEVAESEARAALSGLPARFHRVLYGDIWLRDTAPLFLVGPGAAAAIVRFRFNGWGGKYVLPHDAEVGAAIAERAGLPQHSYAFVLEGGSIEVDGEGTVLTTRQCLLNPNRNFGANQTQLDGWLCESLGARRVLWLDEGLLNDHTDGHIDTIARFVAPGEVVCMSPSGDDDPNARVLDVVARELEGMTDAAGRQLKVHRIPSPGRVLTASGEVMPASYVNFYIANSVVVVPTYGIATDSVAVRALGPLFRGRRVVGVPAHAILSGGGAFHCITQQQPVAR